MTMLGHIISGRVQTFRRSHFVPSHNFCHPEIWMDLTSLRHQVAPSSVFIQFRLAPSGVAENEKKGTDLLPSKFPHYPFHPIPFHYPNRAKGKTITLQALVVSVPKLLNPFFTEEHFQKSRCPLPTWGSLPESTCQCPFSKYTNPK